MAKGYLALVLHAHLPFVRHPESKKYLEERWLYEAVAETYIPLLQVMQGLVRDGVKFKLTFSLTPTLLAMLTDKLLQERCLEHLHKLVELAAKEVVRTEQEEGFNSLALDYEARFTSILAFYQKYNCDLVTAFRELQNSGHLEIITSAATHAFLPLVKTAEALRAQVKTAVSYHTQLFGRKPLGIWLPECGYTPGLDELLQECGLAYFFTESHGVGSAQPAPVFGTLAPVLTNRGVAAFARDEEASRQVWSAEEGYPGDFYYREYYRDIGYDLPMSTIQEYVHPDGIRLNTGIKYYRITGKGEHKEPYNPHLARERAALHAGHFMDNRRQQVEYWQEHMGRKPIVTATYDSELFGHWWFEGPLWLDILLRKLHFDQDTLKTITPREYLPLYADYQTVELGMSSWGRGGFADVWLRGENDWIYPALHVAEQQMVELANCLTEPSALERRVLNQAARELMLAQSSDWAFIMDSKTMVDYAVKRTKQHINRFQFLVNMLQSKCLDEIFLTQVEAIDNIFPNLDYAVYSSSQPKPVFRQEGPKVLLLSWEFPPMTVGGLSRHVYDLSRQLVVHGWQVHVVTAATGSSPLYELVEGVHVHRAQVLQPDGGEFSHWALQLNLSMLEVCRRLIERGLKFDLVHAHDWLVCYTAKTLKGIYGLPLVATIHATEHGRNQGIYTDLQHHIHNLEWRLTYEAQKVIVCSVYMQQEVEQLFQLPKDKVDVIPNGVDTASLPGRRSRKKSKEPYALEGERIILFFGRLVQEKGVQILLQAAPQILAEYPEAKFVIAGKGPMYENLLEQSAQLGLGNKVLFTGFISDSERNRLLQQAEVAIFPSLYEPFGIVALEAMAVSTPVIVSEVGGLGDIVEHGRNGLKIYPGDVNSLATQVKELLQNPKRAKKMAKTAQIEIDRYSWQQIAQKTIEVYHNAMGRMEAGNAQQQIAVGTAAD